MKKLTLIIILSLISFCPAITSFSQAGNNNGEYSLYQNYPNPFDNTTTIKFSLKEDCYVKLYITDQKTGKISQLIDGEMAQGVHGVIFKTDKKTGSGSGNYSDFKCTIETYSLNSNVLVYTSEIKMMQR